jgi:TRAP transporter TAXI family solute receptor
MMRVVMKKSLLLRISFILLALIGGSIGLAHAQGVVQSQEEAIKEQKNRNTVGIATGQLDAAYPQLAQDIAKVLDDGDNLRVIPMITYGSVGNVMDLLYLRNVDIAFTKSDNYEYFNNILNINLSNRLHYIARLYDAELHILVRPEIKALEDLQGKKVNIGVEGNAAHTTVPILMKALGLNFEVLKLDHAIGLQMMAKGEIDAAMRVGGKPMSTFTKAPEGKGFRFLSISASQFARHFADKYVLGKLTHEDYPNLIAKDETITTIAVPDILAVYNWPKGTERRRRVEAFIVNFFKKFEKLKNPPFHPKWKDVNLAATIPGWTRSDIAERMLAELASANANSARDDFNRFLDARGGSSGITSKTQAEREALFREFETWKRAKVRQ